MRSSSRSTALVPISRVGTSAAVSCGRTSSAECRAATPAIEKSCGTATFARSRALDARKRGLVDGDGRGDLGVILPELLDAGLAGVLLTAIMLSRSTG